MGGNYTEHDTVDVFVTATPGDPDSVGRFITNPTLTVVEQGYTITQDIDVQRATAFAKIDVTELDLEQGSLSDVLFQYRDANQWLATISGLNIACVGDGITLSTAPGSGNDYPAQLEAILPIDTFVYNYGVVDTTMSTTLSGISYRETAAYQNAIDSIPDVFIIGLGIHDAENWSTVGIDFYTSAVSMYHSLKTTTNIVLFNRVTPSFVDGIENTDITTINSLLAHAAAEVGASAPINLNSEMLEHEAD